MEIMQSCIIYAIQSKTNYNDRLNSFLMAISDLSHIIESI